MLPLPTHMPTPIGYGEPQGLQYFVPDPRAPYPPFIEGYIHAPSSHPPTGQSQNTREVAKEEPEDDTNDNAKRWKTENYEKALKANQAKAEQKEREKQLRKS